MKLGFRGAVIPLPAVDPRQSPGWGPGKFDFYCQKTMALRNFVTVTLVSIDDAH